MKILIIEDDKVLGESLVEYLKMEKIEALWLHDERNLANVLNVYSFDVIVLDLVLKFSRGEDLITYIREKGIETPILILTAKKDFSNKEECFLRGADDYLIKPFEPKELVLRIQALSKRKRLPFIMNIGDIIINIDAKTIKRGNEELKLSKTAWDLLTLLIKRRGEIVDNETILNYVWAGKAVGDEVIRTYIKELRKILPEGAIENYKGRGYKLS
ncbi:response regulator transcription factor [Thermodesulfovibrio sp. 1176]|uniref:response regulator transcription factor n=1 Tax=Thermodesulfovibrio sp. 1176 TaxID=3043424 RepID=UPI00248219C2|nr:response regulator transcription factor [Thermodesulfovibrio sp. 1176]MDI1471147.1 response regulator transcription factor [Thermodesulfovibrio sp. 1176]